MNEQINGLDYITEEEAYQYINNADMNDELVWTGEKLLHRWDNEVMLDG
jgi:hypothetical protein